jgi:GT2 family glycosyltransferase
VTALPSRTANDSAVTSCDATVIIVSFNNLHFLSDCLIAVQRQTLSRFRFEVLLIDNASTDGSPAFVRERFPLVRVIQAGGNLGFAAANNLGIRLARGRHVVLLNPDTRVAPDWLARLLEAAEADRVGGATSRLLFLDRPGRINSTGLVLYRDGRCGDRDVFRPAAEVDRPRGEVFGGSGASLLLTRGLLDDVGGFDEGLFMYYEDADIAWRARLRGWRFVYVPESVCEHACGAVAISKSPFLLRQTERNRTWLSLRNAPPFEAVAAGVGLILRAARLAYRYIRGGRRCSLTRSHVGSMLWAVGRVASTLPGVPLRRYEVRVARRRCPDRVVRRFIESHPLASS